LAVAVNDQALAPSDYTVTASGRTVVFHLAAGYASGKPFSVAEGSSNSSATSQGIPLSIPTAAFGGQTLG
jgi:hypothetical protein